MISRRSIFGGLAGLLVAPAIVRASSLMPVKPLPSPWPLRVGEVRYGPCRQVTEEIVFLAKDNSVASTVTTVYYTNLSDDELIEKWDRELAGVNRA